jgi:putative exporter of polyketide antibiotics
VATEIAFWAAVALIFASLWSSSEAREPYALTAALALGAWWLLRAGPRRYCERCRLACD